MPTDAAALLATAKAAAKRAAAHYAHHVAHVGETEREHRLAATWHLRRASDEGSVDNRIYANGSNEQCLGGLLLNSIALLGLKAAGAIAYPWLIAASADDPTGTYIDHATAVFRNRERYHWCVELGAYHRFQWKRSVYQSEVHDWQTSPAAQNPDAPWRRRRPRAPQRYLLFLIVDCLAAADRWADPPNAAANRGTVHDWLHEHGGNPMFWHPPAVPAAWIEKGA